MFDQVFKNIDEILHEDADSTSELDHAKQSPRDNLRDEATAGARRDVKASRI